MEYLDIYDESKNYLGKEERSVVHKKGLWHNTIHCWIYDASGNVYFQVRKDELKMYTTASGHVLAGESLEEAFGREIYEEIGIKIDYEKAKKVDVVVWKMDKKKADGTLFIDRAFANTYIYELKDIKVNFKFDESEVQGLIKVNAEEALKVLANDTLTIDGEYIFNKNDSVVYEDKKVTHNDFLIMSHETGLGKYGFVLNKIIEVTKK